MTDHVLSPPVEELTLEEPLARSWWERHRSRVLVTLGRVLLLVGVLTLWEYASGRWIDELFVSRPTDIGAQFRDWIADGTLLRHSQITVIEVVSGFFLGAVSGAIAAFALAPLRLVQRVVDPFIYALYSLPKVALAPLFIVWFGIGIQMKIVLAVITVFFLVFLNTLSGIRQVDRALIDAVRMMGCTRLQLIRKVIFPASLAGLFTGLKVAIPYALIGAVIGELVASNRGVGYLVSDSAARFNTAGVFAALAVLTVLAWLLNMIVSFLDSRASRWKGTD